MSLHGQQDPDRTSCPLDVAIERLEEPVAILHRHQRVEEHDRSGPFVEVAADLLLPTVRPAVGRRPGGV